jgi:hypothetical protein
MAGEPLKCKIVSFRVADEEYLKLEELAKNSGFTSVSYLAREATLRGTPFQAAKAPLHQQIERLGGQFDALKASIEKVIAQLAPKSHPERPAE